VDEVRRAVVFADHRQFYVQDLDGQMAAEADDDYDWPEAWSEEAVEVHRIGLDGPCSIAIGTARGDHVETTLQVHRGGEPPLAEAAEHVVEADLAAPSGAVHVFGCMERPGPEHRVEIPAGQYRIRISHIPSGPPPASVDANEEGPHFRYQLDLWQCAQPGGIEVIRQGKGH
jgi:hypothetical protein